MAIGIQFVDNCRLHLDICVIDGLRLGDHKVLDLLEEPHRVLGLIGRHIQITLLLHAVKEHEFAGPHILDLAHHYCLGRCVDSINDIVIKAGLHEAHRVSTAAEKLRELILCGCLPCACARAGLASI